MLCFYGEDSDDTDIQFEDNLEHFELIERALKENAAEVQRILANVPIVWDGQQWKKPGDCYIPFAFLDHSDLTGQAVLSQLNVPWVSEDYYGKIPAEVFEKSAVTSELKIYWWIVVHMTIGCKEQMPVSLKCYRSVSFTRDVKE